MFFFNSLLNNAKSFLLQIFLRIPTTKYRQSTFYGSLELKAEIIIIASEDVIVLRHIKD